MRYDRLPIIVRGSPGAMGRFRERRRVTAADIQPWQLFPVLVAGLGVLLGVGWLRRMIAAIGPE